MAYTLTQSRKEIGLRVAVGAGRREVLGHVFRMGGRWVGLGVLVGLPLAAGLAQAMSGLLFGVSPFDPLSLLAVAAILTLVAFAALLGPARRAASVDPLVALRYE